MTEATLRLAAALADILAEENAALQRLDFAAAVALLPAKEAAIDALKSCRAPAEGSAAAPPSAVLGRRLSTLAAENRVLLERAITVQSRIVGIVARAARPPTPRSYSATGRSDVPSRTTAIALSTTA